jgi:pimeloyl-ACP methyl ester carboxylesterase
VHGLGGDSYNTYTDETSGKLWLRDILPDCEGFGNSRIMTFGYDARAWLRGWDATSGRSFTFAEGLLGEVRGLRIRTNTEGRPIMFIGHSLGGIVVKKVRKAVMAAADLMLTKLSVEIGFVYCTLFTSKFRGHIRVH